MTALLACLLVSPLQAPPSLHLRDVSGRAVGTFPPAGRGPACFVFVLAECPIANQLAPEIKRIQGKYKGVRFYLVHADPTTTAAAARVHARDYGYRFPVLVDPKHALVRRLGAGTSPEAFVWAKGRVVYRGRINDQFAAVGVRRRHATRHDLRNALDAVAAGRPVRVSKTAAVGCILPPAG